jgi:hypothetical protein
MVTVAQDTAGAWKMSLSIAVWTPDDGAYAGRAVLAPAPGSSTGVGAESLRYQLWGSPAARSLGATILPRLADITIEPEQLGAATGFDPERILGYLATMRHAVERAKAVRGGIIIW